MRSLYALVFSLLLSAGAVPEAFTQDSVFSKVMFDVNGTAQCYAMTGTPDGNYILAGERNTSGFICKIDPFANILFSKKIGSNVGAFYSVAVTADSGFIAAGKGFNPVNMTTNPVIARFDADGDTLWSRMVDLPGYSMGLHIQQTMDGGYVLTGYADISMHKILVTKLDVSGNLQWSYVYDCVYALNIGYTVRQMPDQGFIVTGIMEEYPVYSTFMYLLKIDSQGIPAWAKKLVLPEGNSSVGYDFFIKNDTLVCLAGDSNGSLMVFETSLDGVFLRGWQYYGFSVQFSYEEPLSRIYPAGAGGYLVCHKADPWFFGKTLRISSEGEVLWENELFLRSSDAAITEGGGVLAAGNGPIYGVDMTWTDNPQIGLVRMDSLGSGTTCIYPGFGTMDTLSASFTPVTVNYSATGSLVQITPVIEEGTLTVEYGCVPYLGKINENNPPEAELRIIPNPNPGIFCLERDDNSSKILVSAEVFAATGEKVFTVPGNIPAGTQIRLPGLPAGFYLLKAVYSDASFTQKLVITAR